MKISLFHIFIVIIGIKLLSQYTDFKFALLITLFFGIFIYFYVSQSNDNKPTFDIPMFENITKNKLFEDKKNNLINYVINTNLSFSPEIHKKLINITDIFTKNLTYVFYGKPKLCDHYFDILLEQRNEIINSANSFIITIPQYENYSFFEKYIAELHNLIDDLFEFTKELCPSYTIQPFIPSNEFNDLHSFQQI
jgi:hypothetical protein